MIVAPQPNVDFFEEYCTWLRTQGKAENTVKSYLGSLRNIPEDVDNYFSNPHLLGKKIKVIAYRSYLRFLVVKKQVLDRNELLGLLDTFKPPRNRDNGVNERLYSIPKEKWVDYIRQSPNKVARMGIWIGFQFGLRLSEIIHLRVQDIDFRSKNILIRPHRKTDTQEAWKPRYNKKRTLPFTNDQTKTLNKWINEIRPKDLTVPYLLWNEQGKRKKLGVLSKCFEDWCKIAGNGLDSRKFKPHIMRYSFATYYYLKSNHDVKLVGDLLGHANVSTTSEYLRLRHKESMDKARSLFEQV